MSKVSTNISIDSELKEKARILFSNLGMDLTTAITIFLKQSVREQGIPFLIRKEIPNEVTKRALAEHDEMLNNKEKYKRYNSLEEIIEEVE